MSIKVRNKNFIIFFINREREFNPRFISPSSFEYRWAQKWRDLYIEEQDKKAKLDRELEEARYKVELEMETALREQEANRIREGENLNAL